MELRSYLTLSCQHCHLEFNFRHSSNVPLLIQVCLRGQVRLRQALPGSGLLRPCSHGDLLQRDSGGSAGLHLEELQVPGVPGAASETHQLPEHHHHLSETHQEHLPHHAQLQRCRLPPLVCLHGATGVQRRYESMHHLHRGPVGLRPGAGPHRERMRVSEERGTHGEHKNPAIFMSTCHGGTSGKPSSDI